jgi:DNA-directed RNA polymerase specialized sigma24 family protein
MERKRDRIGWEGWSEAELAGLLGTTSDRAARIELLRRAELIDGDPDRDAPALRKMSVRYPREVAEEAFLEVQCRMWEQLDDFDPERGEIRSWVRKIAENRARQILRSRKRRMRRAGVYAGWMDTTLSSSEDEILDRLDVESVVRIALPEIRQALAPREWEVLQAEASGEPIPDISPGGYRKALCTGRSKAQEIIERIQDGGRRDRPMTR